MILFISFLIAMYLTMVLIPPLMRLAVRCKFLDLPGGRKVHAHPIPRVGGIAIVAGSVLPIAIWLLPDRQAFAFIFGASIILGFGLWDDRKNLDYRMKFVGQGIAILVAILVGGVFINRLPFVQDGYLPLYALQGLTLFALMATTNAINLADGLDGLAGGTSLLSLIAVAIFANAAGDGKLVLIALATSGSLLGFLRFNTYPARIFLGDGGSQFLGFTLGFLLILLTQQTDTLLNPALPLLLIGLPLLDTAIVVVQRLYQRRSPFSPDNNHIHHKFLAIGLNHYEAVFLVYAIQACFIVAGYFLRYENDGAVLASYGAICAALIGMFYVVSRCRSTFPRPPRSPLGESGDSLNAAAKTRISKWTFWFSVIAIALYCIGSAAYAGPVSQDVGALAMALLATLLLIFLKQHNRPFGWIERAILYVACVLMIYLEQHSAVWTPQREMYVTGFFVILAVAIMAGVRTSSGRNFKMTTLDFLVLFVALVIPNLPGIQLSGSEANLGQGAAKAIVIFYGVEFVSTNVGKHWDMFRLAIIITLAIVVFRGLASLSG